MPQQSLSFGIEEEFLLVDLASRDVIRRPPATLLPAYRHELGPCLAEEMFQSQIELVSPILSSLDEGRAWLQESRQRLNTLTRQHGIGLLGSASHPFADWREQLATESPHYRKLFADHGDIARRSLVSGLHVHVGVPNGYDRLRVMNRLVGWLPLLLALSCSSPFWGGRDSAMASYRRCLCGEWPRMGIPEPLPDEQAFDAYVGLLLAAGALQRRGDIWWFIRPSARFATLELRIADACPLVEDALCIAGLFRTLVTWALDAKDDELNGLQRLLLEENYWRARRQGCAARFLDARGHDELSAAEWLAQLEQLVGAAGEPESFTQAARILREGSSAQRQRRVLLAAQGSGLSERQALCAVVDSLLEETARQCERPASLPRSPLVEYPPTLPGD
ncbi:carboxylate-amine ligase [Pseudomonas sp. Gutcm_11s]|uniref:carboxylate-amine ligase n=1 Tax=Pseudomonas sp. Gutcm_11s TaxID=3026088 RepID=UPI00235FEC3B|nr:carboxylate-amine ligase [Pseudomonas sp. Gutcm_11s]MDD0843567.1 carboxylate-amine ligase [Pseudomonas sp. Gutcm_11s]